MEDAPAPACEWKAFRDCALVMISCQQNANEQGLSEESRKWGRIVENLSSVAQRTSPEKMSKSVDLFGVCELINWLSTINSYLHPSHTFQKPLRAHISQRTIFEATQTAHQEGICQNRLWNLTVGGGEREEIDLPILMKMLQSRNATNPSSLENLHRSSDHDNCTAEVCCLSSIDSTRVQQLHKCSGDTCGEPLWFTFSKVEGPPDRIIWWLDDGEESPYVVDPKEQRPYMAISHVWSDGTGGGVQGEGRVNRCLFHHFKDIARTLGCTAIWWDTISIPLERVARQKAISRMHENFREASHTVIHDQSLTQTPWTNDGRPCLALVLSSWFTRAWTALELMMSRREKVSVIYQDPNDCSRYTVKNLDKDVLAQHPAYTSRGHWVASLLIRQLREQQFNSVGDILKVLRTRNTSWPRDLIVVAGLLTGHEPRVDVSHFTALITRDIVLDLVEIKESFLYHRHATMHQQGAFSWCPFSLLDVHVRTDTNRVEKIFVDEHGSVTGNWTYRTLSKEDVDKVRPYRFHISVNWQIRSALQQWKRCLLMRRPYHDDLQALLVIPLAVEFSKIDGTEYKVLDCQFVGTVYTNLEWYSPRTISFRLGKLTENLSISAEEAIDKYNNTEGSRMCGHPYRKNLDAMRQARRQRYATTGGR